MASNLVVPAVTVLFPVHNGERYLREAVESILRQTFTSFQLLIMDDGSVDGTATICHSFTDSRIRYVHQAKNIGLVATLNEGIDLVETSYVARMDADDVALPERLERQLNFLEKDPTISACGTWAVELRDGKPGRLLKPATGAALRRMVWRPGPILHPTACIRSDVLRQFKYRPEMVHAEDYDLWLRLSGTMHRMDNIPEVLLQYRIHPASISQQQRREQLESSLRAFGDRFPNIKLSLNEYESLIGRTYAVHPQDRMRLKRSFYRELFENAYWSACDDVLYAARWLRSLV